MKKTLLILFIIFSSTSTFSQIIERGYNARNLGSSFTEAQNIFCNGNPSASGTDYELNVYTFDQFQTPLQENTLYETIDEDDNIRYIYVISQRSNPFSDRDGFPAASVNIIEFICPDGNSNQDNSNPNDIIEIGYIARNLGNDLSSAQFEYCSNANKSNAGQRYQLNVRSNQSASRLEVGSFYRQITEDNQVRYVYIVGFNTSVFADRDLYDINEFTEQPLNFSCDYDGDGIDYVNDNCHDVYNPDQADFDQDGQGDACDNEDDRDFDNDGIRNHDDICPNEAGPVSNNGCPGLPDFIVTKIKVNNKVAPNLALKKNSQNDFCIEVKNQGNVEGAISRVELILANGTDLVNAPIVANLMLIHNSSIIMPDKTLEVCSGLYLGENYSGNTLSRYTMIHAIIHSSMEESNQDNNHSIEQLNTTSLRTEFPKVILDLEDFSRITVNNKQEEKEALSQLKKGKLYLIKGKRDAQKILIEE